jgi:hypothetical protein
VGPTSGLDDVEKILALRGLELDPLVVQHVANRYTDYAIPAPLGLRQDFIHTVPYTRTYMYFITVSYITIITKI